MIGQSETNDTDRRLLVVNADDFGLSERTNEGILRAHAQGIVTSTDILAAVAIAGIPAQRAVWRRVARRVAAVP